MLSWRAEYMSLGHLSAIMPTTASGLSTIACTTFTCSVPARLVAIRQAGQVRNQPRQRCLAMLGNAVNSSTARGEAAVVDSLAWVVDR